MTLQLSKGGKLAIIGGLVAVAAVVVGPKFVSLPGSAEESDAPVITAEERAALRDAARARRVADANASAARTGNAAPAAGPASATVANATPAGTTAGAKTEAKAGAKPGEAPKPASLAAANARPPAPSASEAASASPARPNAPAAAASRSPRVRVAERASAESSLRTMTIDREVYAYASGARRDPFKTLMVEGDLRPLLSELRLTSVAYDRATGKSVAILRDLGNKMQYRVRAGERLGRARVARILPKSVVFTIEELGYSRQETLALTDSTTGVKGK